MMENGSGRCQKHADLLISPSSTKAALFIQTFVKSD